MKRDILFPFPEELSPHGLLEQFQGTASGLAIVHEKEGVLDVLWDENDHYKAGKSSAVCVPMEKQETE